MGEVLALNAVGNLLGKGGNLVLYIQEGYYKGSAACEEFPFQIDLLKIKLKEWQEQLREHGMEEDPHIKSLVELAAKSLEEEEKRVRKIKSRFKRTKIMAFPDQLTLTLKQIIAKIDAAPELVASRVKHNDLLRKLAAQRRSPLPFGPENKYVPITSAVKRVRNALEDFSGPRVVTISGIPGLGKTGLAKHIALVYDKQLQEPLSPLSQPCFPDGVHFFKCGKGYKYVTQLQGLLLQSLGFGPDSAPPESSSSQIQERGDYMQFESNKIKLRSCLAKRKVLIIFDDVWEPELVEKLINPGEGVKYLITSQIKQIWDDALNVELENPDMDQAIKIMAKNTKGLSPPCEFTDCVKTEVKEIIPKLNYHPLSIATVAVSVNHKRITDPETWKEVKENIHELVRESTLHSNPLMYEMRYPLPVAASMMLMVNSLQHDPRELLFVTALCDLHDNLGVPETIVKYFFQFLQPRRRGYGDSKQYLEGRSIIESYEIVRRDRWASSDEVLEAHLTMHGLRRHSIREEMTDDLRSTATSILSKRINGTTNKSSDADWWSTATRILSKNYKNWTASGSSDANIPNAMRLQLAAVYGGESRIFREVILKTTIDDAPWISSGKEALDLVKSGGQKLRNDLHGLLNLIRLLNVNTDAGGWEREANDSASKILLRWICRGELDDGGMARLLELPRTTSKACTALKYIFGGHMTMVGGYVNILEYTLGRHIGLFGDNFLGAYCFEIQGQTFSRSNPKTMKSLTGLVHNNAAEPIRRAAVVAALGVLANSETKDTIILLAEKWAQMLADNSNPGIQFAAAETLVGDLRLGVVMGACEGVLEALLDNLKSIEDLNGPLRLDRLCRTSKDNAVSIANIPGALEKILAAFVSERLAPGAPRVPLGLSSGYTRHHHYKIIFGRSDHRLRALLILSSVVENKMKFVPVLSSLLRVVETLLPVASPKHWYESSDGGIGDMLDAARIVGNLGLVPEIRDIIMARPSIKRGLLNLLEGRSEIDQLGLLFSFLDIYLCDFPSRVAARTLTVLGVSYDVDSTPSALSTIRESAVPCALMYIGRAEAKEELRHFSEALEALNSALDHLSQLIRPNPMEELTSDNSIEIMFTGLGSASPGLAVRFEILLRSALLKGKLGRYHDAIMDVDKSMEMFPEGSCSSHPLDLSNSTLFLKEVLERRFAELVPNVSHKGLCYGEIVRSVLYNNDFHPQNGKKLL